MNRLEKVYRLSRHSANCDERLYTTSGLDHHLALMVRDMDITGERTGPADVARSWETELFCTCIAPLPHNKVFRIGDWRETGNGAIDDRSHPQETGVTARMKKLCVST